MKGFGWWVVLESAEVSTAPLGVRRFGTDYVFWRTADGSLVCQEDVCPHRGAKLSEGKVVDGCLECPFHGFVFDAEGACTKVPAHPDRRVPKAMRARTLPVREAHGFVWLWVDDTIEPTGDLPWFEDVDPAWSVAGFEQTWDAHLSRCVEIQLDWTHLAFVHRKTLGRFVEEDSPFETEAGTVGDPDTPPGDPGRPGYIRLRFGDRPEGGLEWREPNVWINRLSAKTKITLVFVPIDELRTKLYMHNWQNQVPVPGLAWLWQQFYKPFNRWILSEDRGAVEAQRPRATQLDMDERLVPSDQPILEYRKLQKVRADRRGADEA